MDNDKESEFLRDRAANEFMVQWDEFNTVAAEDDIPKLIEQIKVFEQIQNNSNRAIILFSEKDFKPLYWGGNFEKLFGYNKEEINLWNAPFFFNALVWEHIRFPLDIIKWNKKINDYHPLKDGETNNRAYFCGIKVKHKDGHIIRLFVNQVILSVKNNQQVLSFFYLEDIQHLMKDSFYWSRYARGANQEKTQFYRSKGQKKEFTDIISPREKEILLEIINGKNSIEISESLNISPATVMTHRKNMIARSGARNTTALIQLCKLCNAI